MIMSEGEKVTPVVTTRAVIMWEHTSSPQLDVATAVVLMVTFLAVVTTDTTVEEEVVLVLVTVVPLTVGVV